METVHKHKKGEDNKLLHSSAGTFLQSISPRDGPADVPEKTIELPKFLNFYDYYCPSRVPIDRIPRSPYRARQSKVENFLTLESLSRPGIHKKPIKK